MSAAFLLLAVLVFRPCLWADASGNSAPSISPDSIVNSANGSSQSLAPNAIATIHGANLSFGVATTPLGNLGASLPTQLGGVQVVIGGLVAPLLYVSPDQVNFLIPGSLTPGQTTLALTRDGSATTPMPVTLLDAAPALFLVDSNLAATHADGSLISKDAPARPGEVIVVYCTGLGRTRPDQIDGFAPAAAAQILLLNQLQVLFGGQAVPPSSILYAGITPGSPGLYQINVIVPDATGASPDLQIALGQQMSQEALPLAVAVPGP